MKYLEKVKIVNILLPILLFLILLLINLSEKTIYIFIMTLFIGWIFPYLVLLITGFAQVKSVFPKLGLTLNVIGIPMCILLIYLVSKIYDGKLLIFIIEYSIIVLMNIINIIYYLKYLKQHPNEETEQIKKIKKKNNGAIV